MEAWIVFEIRRENGFDFLSEEYLQLFARSRTTAFQHPIWLDRLYHRLAPQMGAQPAIITARRAQDGGLAMLLPLMRRRRGALQVVEFADLGVSDYSSAVCDDATFESLLCQTDLSDTIRARLAPFDILRIKKMRDGGLPLEPLFGIYVRTPMSMKSYAAPLYRPWAKWRADNIGESYRKQLDRRRRQLDRMGGVRFAPLRDPELITSAFHAMREYRGSRFPDDVFQLQAYFDFYLEIALRGNEVGFSRTYSLSLEDGRSISCVFGLVYRRQFLIVLGGCDLTNYRSRSIGSLTYEDIARDCVERQDELLDFTIGDESYKQLFGGRPREMWMLTDAATPPGRLASFVERKAPWAVKVAEHMLEGAPRAAAAQAKDE